MKKGNPAARDDKRITRVHQMEMMEAAARGTAPSMQLDVSRLPSTGLGRSAIVAEDFLSTVPASSVRESASGRGGSRGNFFSQRDKYEVDQSVNLMDASNMHYSASETRTIRKSRSSSFVDIFLGGNGSTSGSVTVKDTRKKNVKTSWKTSVLGRILIALIFLGFVVLFTLSVNFFQWDVNENSMNGGSETKPITTAVDNAASTGPATFASVDYDTTVEDRDRFEDLKTTLLNQGATTPDRLEDETSAAFYAARWLTDDDSMQVELDNPALLTRFALATLFYATHLPTQTGTSTQRQVLDDETAKISKQQWGRENEWMAGSSVCEWYGVGCQEGSEEPASVVHLNVTSNGLRGTIPLELQLLKKLELLDLSSNELSGTIPTQLGSMGQIKFLMLQKNSLSGTIPKQLQDMHNAYQIDLSNNQLSGGISDSFHKLSNLRWLHLHHNLLSGSVENIAELKDINHLHLEYNAFDGSLPSTISRLTMLNDLRLANNKLTGTIPSEMAANTMLGLLYLGNNKLNGQIPEMFDSLNKLTDLELHANRFTSELPTSIGALTSLRRLTLEGNIFTGHLPSEWGKLTELQALDLYHNGIVGSIPTEFGKMQKLHDLSLGHNFLQGKIPSELGQLTRLKHLGLQHCALKGAVPSQLGNLKALAKLELAQTIVTGTVPDEICDLTLQVLEADCKGEIECSCCSKCM